MNFYYRCSECEQEFEITSDLMVCPDCSQEQKFEEPLRGILEVVLEGRKPAEFLIPEFLPVGQKYFPDIPELVTPLWRPEKLTAHTGFKNLYIKDETRQLTGSLKDRASLLVSAFARQENLDEIVVASTGNAASSMAGIGALAGQRITIFLPENAPRAKMVQSLQYGARVIPCAGNYDLAFDLSLEYSKTNKVLSRNTAYNPLTIDGKKTVALEIFQQLRKAPDYVFVPTGDAVILGGVYKGFRDLKKFNYIDEIPCIFAVQSEGSKAIYEALQRGSFSKYNPDTVADSISVGIPRNGYYALKMLKKYKGECITATDQQILEAQKELSSRTGLFTEPAAAASYAGFLKSSNVLDKDATIVLLATGNGLKDIDSAMKTVNFPEKSISSLEEL